MKRLLTCTTVGLFIGLTPAMAQSEPPVDESQTPPAMQEPAQPEAIPMEPTDPAEPIPGELAPRAQTPDPALPPSSLSTEAPKSASPDRPAMTMTDSPQFLNKQERDDLLASSLIGETVVNANNETIGTVSDLISDPDGKVTAVLIRSGDFLGIGGKDVALRFEDVKFSHDENGDLTVMANIDANTLASAPDYETLAEQKVKVGSNGESN